MWFVWENQCIWATKETGRLNATRAKTMWISMINLFALSMCFPFFSIPFGCLVCVRDSDFSLTFIRNAPLLKSRSVLRLILHNNLLNSSLMHSLFTWMGTHNLLLSNSLYLYFFQGYVHLSFSNFVPSNCFATCRPENIQLTHMPEKEKNYDSLWFPLDATSENMYNRSSAEKSPICIVGWSLKYLPNAPL